MADLQGLEEQFSDQGFHVVGFYSNDFGNQGGTDEQIDKCTEDHAVTFLTLQIDHVRYSNPAEMPAFEPRPVFSWLLGLDNPGPAPSSTPVANQPTWNFHKYLISRNGQLLAHWSSPTPPTDPSMISAIQDALAR